ncbi:hypothetical protein CMV_022970 [Castanea mollissima]|uniref:Uncharacterized protein n=1 Tax=Castanea mollissima TaxID=60419 RepID=A0A8J4QR66_9ROSI|nr:hypothetical protein CMV_022970 [Castanea mollissima]
MMGLCSVDHAVWFKRSLLSIWRYRSSIVHSRPPQGWKVIAGVCHMKKNERTNLDEDNFVAEQSYILRRIGPREIMVGDELQMSNRH